MISKKVLFPLAAVAMASFVACGDDSSSGSPASGNTAPASIQKFEEIDDVACSQTANLCAKVYLVEHNDTLQCNGSQWNTMINDQPVAGCENAAPVANDSAAQEPAAQDPAANDPAAQDPAGPGAGEEPATGTVGCMKAGVCSEGPAALASECSAEEGEELLDACPAGGEVCDIGEDGITMYFYADAAMSCDDYKAMIAAFSEMAQ